MNSTKFDVSCQLSRNYMQLLKRTLDTLSAILHLGTLCSSLALNGKRQTTTRESILKSPLSSPRK